MRRARRQIDEAKGALAACDQLDAHSLLETVEERLEDDELHTESYDGDTEVIDLTEVRRATKCE